MTINQLMAIEQISQKTIDIHLDVLSSTVNDATQIPIKKNKGITNLNDLRGMKLRCRPEMNNSNNASMPIRTVHATAAPSTPQNTVRK